jgi:hypothetical protein
MFPRSREQHQSVLLTISLSSMIHTSLPSAHIGSVRWIVPVSSWRSVLHVAPSSAELRYITTLVP